MMGVNIDQTPLISIVMPTFNGEKYISDAIQSVRQQDYSNFELLICDAGSTDNTLRILNKMNDSRVKIVSRSDRNLPDGINRGFAAARGEILCWLNCDDMYLHPEALFTVAKQFRAQEKLDYLVGMCGMVSEEGQLYRILLPWILRSPFSFQGYSNIFTGALFFRQSTWKEFGEFSIQYTLAFEYQLLKFLMGKQKKGKVEASVPIAGFRIRPDSLSGANSSKMRGQLSEILSEPFNYPITTKHQLIRAISYLSSGQVGQLLKTVQLNRELPCPWSKSFLTN